MDAQKLANMFSGFGAGVQGRLPEFQRGMMLNERLEKQDALDKQNERASMSRGRKEAMALDMRGVAEMLEAGFEDQAITKLNKRMQVGMMLPDFDPVSTEFVKDLIVNGKKDEALKFLNVIDQGAVGEGILDPRPERQTTTLKGDERVVDTVTNEVLVPALEPEPEEPKQGTDRNGVLRYTTGPNKGDPVFPDVTDETVSIPPALLETVPQSKRVVAAEVFQAVGGGNAGVSAVTNMVDAEEKRVAAEDLEKKARSVQIQAIRLGSSILGNPEATDVVGPAQGGFHLHNVFDPDNARAVADIEELANILTAENLDLMSGVLSESDMRIIASVAGGGLDRRRGDEEFIKRVSQIVLALARSQNFTPEELNGMSDDDFAAYEKVIMEAP